MAQNKTVCYQTIQVTYRNAMVSHLRATLVDAIPDQGSSIVRQVLGEVRWSEAKAIAEKARATSGMTIQLVDDFDLVGVEHFSLFFGRYFLELCPLPKGTDGEMWRSSKKRLLDWVDSIREGRNVISHPNSDDLDFSDSYRLLDTCRRILDKLGLEKAAAEVAESTRELDGYAFVEDRNLESFLPNPERIVIGFIGRDKELNGLREWFYNPSSRHWLLAGDGGKGKSALAYQFACEILEKGPPPYQVVAWLSAKKRQFDQGRSAILPQPDFFDLDSVLSKLLIIYGFDEEVTRDVDVKRGIVKDLLNSLPALLVVDDVDSIETANENIIDFFQSEIALTKTKVLFTSRRTLFGMGGTMTHVEGLLGKDGEGFIRSRQRLMGLNVTLTAKNINDLLRVTEGSPLFITDLIRLMRFISPNDAISAWAKREGHEARRFALGRELELLSREAKSVLIAGCVTSGVTSRVELESITGYSSDVVISALHELNKLFLSPKPRVIEGEERYEISENVRLLVRDVQGGTELFRRMEAAYKAVSGQLPRIRDPKIDGIVRQAVFKVRQRDYDDARKLLENALVIFPNQPVLIGFLGWVFKAWDPPRVTEARELFRRADSLGVRDSQMYRHWAGMEGECGDWSTAATVAEKGLSKDGDDKELLFLAGYARSRYAKVLLGSAQMVGARQELLKAKDYLRRALTPADELLAHGRTLNAKAYRAMVLVCEKLGLAEDVYRFFEMWAEEHPEDKAVRSERDRIVNRFPLLRAVQ